MSTETTISDNDKISYFEYTIIKLLEWYRDNNQNKVNTLHDNDFSLLKTMKLLFFVSANTVENNSSITLTKVFNKFSALPYGPVESFIYDQIKKNDGKLNRLTITTKHTEELESPHTNKDLDEKILLELERSIDSLKKINPNFVNLSAFELVDLSHMWYSWQHNYREATSKGVNSKLIDPNEIIKEDKIYRFVPF